MAATVPVESGGVNPLLDSALGIGEKTVGVTATEPEPKREPQNGTYEKFMSSFGAPQRWAGH